MSKGIHELLRRTDRGVNDAKDSVAMMWRSILLDLNITPDQWDKLITRYVRSHNDIRKSKTRESSDRSNKNRTLARPTMRWRALQTGLDILGPKRISYDLYFTWDRVTYPKEKPTHMHHIPRSRGNMLRDVFRKLTAEIGMHPTLWHTLIDQYAEKIVGPGNPTQKSTKRGNENKALMDNKELTWVEFARGLRILRVSQLTFTINLQFEKYCTQHTFYFDIETESAEDKEPS